METSAITIALRRQFGGTTVRALNDNVGEQFLLESWRAPLVQHFSPSGYTVSLSQYREVRKTRSAPITNTHRSLPPALLLFNNSRPQSANSSCANTITIILPQLHMPLISLRPALRSSVREVQSYSRMICHNPIFNTSRAHIRPAKIPFCTQLR